MVEVCSIGPKSVFEKSKSGSNAAQHGMNRSEINHAFTTAGAAFIVLAEATVTTQPGEGTLHDPTSWQNNEALLVGRALDHVEGDLQCVTHPLNQTVVLVDAVRPDALEGGDGFGDFAQDILGAVIVLDVGGVDHDLEQIAEGIHHNMAFTAVDPFAGVVTTGATDFGRLDALTIDNGCTRIGHAIPFGSLLGAIIPSERSVHTAPRVVEAPLAKVIVDAVGIEQIVGHIRPGDAVAYNIQNRVEHFT